MTRVNLNKKININNKDFWIYKEIQESHGTLLYLQFQVALINSVNQKSIPDCHIWYKKVPP